MQQVLFTIPVLKSTFPPDGIPVGGFGTMLCITFILVTVWGMYRVRRIGMKPEKFQDMVVWIFVTGLIGARLLYMIQYANQFPNEGVFGAVAAFFQIWRGGIIFYGSVFGGVFGYGLFYWFVLRKLHVSGWQVADLVAPLLALGVALGRIGCYLNGCCWGQVAVAEVAPVPLGGAHFPLLAAHARDQLVDYMGPSRGMALQSSAGFTVAERNRSVIEDPRSRVVAVEKDSAAAKAGVQPGDRVVKLNGEPNRPVLDVAGPADQVKAAVAALRKAGVNVEEPPNKNPRAYFDDFDSYRDRRNALLAEGHLGVTLTPSDSLWEKTRDWYRGHSSLALGVQRGESVVDLPPFTPRSLGLYPTQLYETLSTLLLIPLLLAFFPFRRHDGQVMVVCMIGYAVHRFINESLRVEPSVGLGLTLSQWGSVVIFVSAVCIELYLRLRTPPLSRSTTPHPG